MVAALSPSALDGVAHAIAHEAHVLIIGAGITGLVLAQALKEHDVAFTVFERDADVSARGRGWGLTIHWSLDTFVSLLPQHIVERLPETYVDPEASKRGENGNFLFFDLRSGDARWKVPPNKRIRVSRERLRALLLEGLDVQVYICIQYLSPSYARVSSEQQADDSHHVVQRSGPAPSNPFPLPLPLPIRSQLISPTLHRLQAHCSLELMARDRGCAPSCCHTTHRLRSTIPSRCDCWVPASSILGTLLSSYAL